jgi:ankyrin repeat protein
MAFDCADPDALDHRGFTALHRAAELEHIGVVKLLLERDAAEDVEAAGA